MAIIHTKWRDLNTVAVGLNPHLLLKSDVEDYFLRMYLLTAESPTRYDLYMQHLKSLTMLPPASYCRR